MRLNFSRWLAPIGNPVAAGIETLVLPVCMLALGVCLNPADVLFVRTQFGWPWLAPLVLALRYGPLPGLGGAMVLFLGWFALEGMNIGARDLPKLYFLGGLITVMLAGEFSSIWRTRVRRAEATQEYLDRRLDSLTHTHYLLRLSHDRLEQELFSRPVSMRDALAGLREIASKATDGGVFPAGDAFLKLCSQFCQIERAALVPVVGGKLLADQIHCLGASFEIVTSDPLVQYAVETGLLCHVASKDVELRADSRYLVVASVSDVAGISHGLLIVDALPFFALHEETLQMLNLMLGYYGDSLSSAALVMPVQVLWPGCPSAFALELQRLTHLRQVSEVPSTLVSLEFTPELGEEDLPQRILRQQRSLDVTWLLGSDPAVPRAILAILPLAREAAVEGYFARIELWLEKQLATTWEGAGIRYRSWRIGEEDPLLLLKRVLEECNVADEARALRIPA